MFVFSFFSEPIVKLVPTHLEVMFRDFNFTTHGAGLACIHAIGMWIVGYEEHLIIPALPVKGHKHTRPHARQLKRAKSKLTTVTLLSAIGDAIAKNCVIFQFLPTETNDRLGFANHQSVLPVADRFWQHSILQTKQQQTKKLVLFFEKLTVGAVDLHL